MTEIHEEPRTRIRVEDVISGREGIRGMQWLLSGGESLDTIRRVLSSMLEAPDLLGDCRLTRAKFHCGQKLTAHFEIALHPAGFTRPVVATWSKEPRSGVQDDASENIHIEAKHREVSAPFRKLSAESPEWNLRLKVAPFDTAFPQLVRLSDPAYAGEVLGTPSRVAEVRWLRYRPGRRHVLSYQVESPTGLNRVFLKVYSASHARRTYNDSIEISKWLEANSPEVRCLGPDTLLETDSAMVFPQARGEALSDYCDSGNPSLPSLLERTGRALRLLPDVPAALTRGRRQDFAAQTEMLASTVSHRAALLPQAARALPGFMDRARRIHERIGSKREVFAHGDMKAEHVYVNDRQLVFIDFDCRCLADPAFDAGKFMADLDLRLSQYGSDGVEQAQLSFLKGYAPSDERRERIRLWQALMMVYLGWRRVKWFSPDPMAALTEILSRADRVLQCVETRGGLQAARDLMSRAG